MKINRSCKPSLSFPEQSGVWLPSPEMALAGKHTEASGGFFLGSTVGTNNLEVDNKHINFQRHILTLLAEFCSAMNLSFVSSFIHSFVKCLLIILSAPEMCMTHPLKSPLHSPSGHMAHFATPEWVLTVSGGSGASDQGGDFALYFCFAPYLRRDASLPGRALCPDETPGIGHFQASHLLSMLTSSVKHPSWGC